VLLTLLPLLLPPLLLLLPPLLLLLRCRQASSWVLLWHRLRRACASST
jgi:hypothetical protein